MTKIAVIFPVFNGLAYTKKCLKALFTLFGEQKNNSFHFDVIIVDDGSSDGTGDWIKENYPQVKLLHGNGDLWWSGGINMALKAGMEEMGTDYFVWWNNDIIPASDYFGNLTAIINKYSAGTVIGSKIYLDENFNTIWSMGGMFNVKNGFKSMIGTGLADEPKFQVPQPCDWLTGMGTVTHRSVYEKIGMLDEKKFPQYHGDADFTLRAKLAGFEVIAVPELKIYNDTRHSGLKHDESFSRLWKSLFSIRSNFNIKKDFEFYNKHVTSIVAYEVPALKYLSYIGGYFKWKFLGFFGKKRPS